MTYKPLEDYFNNLEPIREEHNDMYDQYEEPLTSVYFQISSPAVEQYPKNEHTVRLEWTDGARWYDVVWEVLKVLEAQYGYDIKSKVFFNVHELNIQAEESHGDPDIAKQMFSKGLS